MGAWGPGHFDNDGALDLLAGVTSARDMANDTDGFLKRVDRFDKGDELGPRVLKARIIDGTGEFAGPTKMRSFSASIRNNRRQRLFKEPCKRSRRRLTISWFIPTLSPAG